jgi:spermidine/putrescine-binding protein
MKKLFFSPVLLIAFSFITSCTNSSGEKATENTVNTEGASNLKGKTLNILCWEGYADAKLTKPFEEMTGATVKSTYYASSDELIAKLTEGRGGVYDIVTPSPDMAQALVERDLVQPIDLKKITHYDSLAEKLRAMQDVVKEGATYGVPFTWGPDYLVYNADIIKEEPKSWNILFDPKYKGKVALKDDISSIYLAGILNGDAKMDKTALYSMNDIQIAGAKKKLMDLKPQAPQYWASARELNDLMKTKKVVVAMGWPITSAILRKGGMNIKGIIPNEGATGWIDRLMITRNATNKDLAEQWIDYITKAENMAKVAEVTGYSVSNNGAARFLTPDLLELTQMNNTQYYFDKLNFWQYVKNRKKYNDAWSEVKGNK